MDYYFLVVFYNSFRILVFSNDTLLTGCVFLCIISIKLWSDFLKTKYKNIIIKIIGSIIVMALFTGIIMKIPKLPFIGGSEEGWLGFWGGIFGSLLGVLGAYLVMKDQLDTEKSEKEQSMKPIVTFGKGRTVVLTDRNITKTNVEIPIINGGQSPVFNLTITYEILEEEIFSNDAFRGNIEFIGESILVKHGGFEFPKNSEIIYIPVLMPGEHNSVKINSFISELYFYLLSQSKLKEEVPDFKFKISLEFRNYNNETITEEFLIKFNFVRLGYNKNEMFDKVECYLELVPPAK